MSNRCTRLNSLVNSIRTRRAIGLEPETWPWASVEVIRDDQSLEALAEVQGSRRTFAAGCAQDCATRDGVAYSLWENGTHEFRVLKQTETASLGWARIDTFEPKVTR